jgi:hypothetical protein
MTAMIKTLWASAIAAALTITATAQAQVTVATNYGHPTPIRSADSVSFRPFADWFGVVALRYANWNGGTFTMTEPRRVDYLIVEFKTRNYSTAPFAYVNGAPISTPPGFNWVAVEVNVRNGIPSTRIASYGWGTAPRSFEFYQGLLPAL